MSDYEKFLDAPEPEAEPSDADEVHVYSADFDGDFGPLQEQMIEKLRSVYDPEIPVNIYDLGLVYALGHAPSGAVAVQMTLTSPGCPAAQSLPVEVKQVLETIPGVPYAEVEVVWEPPWTMDNMSEEAKLQLGLI
jgi:FeS assembly SUF system protein